MSEARLAGCQGKATFDSPHAAARLLRHHKPKWKATKIYRCRHCHKWHYGGIIRANKPKP